MKSTADVVIIGGGIQGTSVAYHLAKRGITNTVLVEMDLVGSGSSGRSAAMFMLGMSREETIRLSQESFSEYLRIGQELGDASAFKQIGYLTVATEKAAPHLREEYEIQKRMGVPSEILSPDELKVLVPALNVDDIVFATICRSDGVIDPHGVMQTYSREARAAGVIIEERVQAVGIECRIGKVHGVQTTDGFISAPTVVNAAGARAAEVGSWLGLDLPIKNYKRHIFITGAFSAIPEDSPFVMDLEVEWYFRKEGAAVLMGMGREESKSTEPQMEWEFQERLVERALLRAPILTEARIVRGWAGLRSLTPDDLPILGPVPGVQGYFNCCGWGGHGVMHGPIGGILTAEIIADGHASTMDIGPFLYDRFLRH